MGRPDRESVDISEPSQAPLRPRPIVAPPVALEAPPAPEPPLELEDDVVDLEERDDAPSEEVTAVVTKRRKKGKR